MRQLKVPSGEDFEHLKDEVEFNSQEKSYWENMIKRRDTQYGEEDFQGKINFYLQELQASDGQFGDRVAVERRLKYLLGHAHEWLGTYELEGHEPIERADMFEKAVLWYQSADETVGFFTDYSLRQAESCGGAAHYRKKAGLEDEITQAFSERGGSLLSTVLGGLTGGAPVTILNGPMPEYLKQMADKKLDSVANAYLFRDHSNDHMLN